MKLPLLIATLLIALLTGCARSTIQSRLQEKQAAYSGLSAETKSLVDQGRIKVGMPMDAVYIAWGKPSEILEGQNAQGSFTTWRYYGTTFEEVRYWSHRPLGYYDHYGYYEPYLQTDYLPRNYVTAEVVFQEGAVAEWHTLPRPTY